MKRPARSSSAGKNRFFILALLTAGGALIFAIWLQAQLDHRLHRHATVLGRVSPSREPAMASTTLLSAGVVAKPSESLGRPTQVPQAPIPQPAEPVQKTAEREAAPFSMDNGKPPPVRQPVKSASGPAHVASRHVRREHPHALATTQEASRDPTYSGTFAHH